MTSCKIASIIALKRSRWEKNQSICKTNAKYLHAQCKEKQITTNENSSLNNNKNEKNRRIIMHNSIEKLLDRVLLLKKGWQKMKQTQWEKQNVYIHKSRRFAKMKTYNNPKQVYEKKKPFKPERYTESSFVRLL